MYIRVLDVPLPTTSVERSRSQCHSPKTQNENQKHAIAPWLSYQSNKPLCFGARYLLTIVYTAIYCLRNRASVRTSAHRHNHPHTHCTFARTLCTSARTVRTTAQTDRAPSPVVMFLGNFEVMMAPSSSYAAREPLSPVKLCWWPRMTRSRPEY